MIIKALSKSPLRFNNRLNLQHLLLAFSQNNKNLPDNIRPDLQQKLSIMNLRTERSIFMSEAPLPLDDQGLSSKRNKYVHKELKPSQKQQLGILIPKPTFPLRLTRQAELQYRQNICEQLYRAQKENLETSVRILQLQGSNVSTNIDEYINHIYKDIFARFMLSKGYGVQWESFNSKLGFMNPEKENNAYEQIRSFYKWLLQFLQWYPALRKDIVGLYSYKEMRYINFNEVNVENIFKIGYFFTIELTEFGKFTDSFSVLRERGQKIELLLMLQDPLKSLNIEAICIEPNSKMIILSKYTPIKTIQSYQISQEIKGSNFLITSIDVFNDHKDYFNQNGYTKHSIFDSYHLVQMKAGNNIRIVEEIEGYSRKGGAFVIDRFSGVQDFERAQFYQLSYKNKYISEEGSIMIEGIDKELFITDPKHIDIFLQSFEKLGTKIQKFGLFSTYQDQIYSWKDQKLHFKIADKFMIPISKSIKSQLEQILKKSVVEESKIKIGRLKKFYSKPRDKRRDKKLIKESLKQETQYLSLQQSMANVDELSLSVLSPTQNSYQFPLILKQEKNQQQIFRGQKVMEKILQSLQIQQQEVRDTLNHTKFSFSKEILEKYIAQLNQQQKSSSIKYKLKIIYLSPNLLRGYNCFKNYSQKPHLSNIVIQPQSKTEDIVPYFFHLHYMYHKILAKNSHKKQSERGRRVKHSMLNLDKLFTLIKFHPTIHQSQRNRKVQQVLFGVLKANNQQQYGYGLEALRLWVARNDSYLGDRQLVDRQVNKQIEIGSFIRKVYWQIIPLLKINIDRVYISDQSSQIQLQNSSSAVPREKLSYLHNFMIDHINYYILNMEECYTKLNLTKALRLTEQFFKDYVDEIFVQTVRKRIISFPFSQETKQHLYVIKKIMQLIPVITPLLPFSSYHVLNQQITKWPTVNIEDVRPQLILNYNRMTKLRVEVRNKFLLNQFHHSQMVIQLKKQQGEEGQSNEQSLDIWRLNKRDLELFFGLQNVSVSQPKQLGRSFKLKLKKNHPIGEVPSLIFYEYKDICVRCSPKRHYGTHLCSKCLQYLNVNYGKRLPLLQ